MLDFAALPPEVNSTRMYSGAGAAPLLTAGTAWGSIAAELASTASAIAQVVTGLAATWLGPSAMAMTQSAMTYVGWLTSTAGLAEQTAAQATAAASAFETAYAMTVPPMVIAANRAQLLMLIATNILGQNTPAIAANEAMYTEFWSQDAAAMNAYSASSTAATSALPQFTPAPQTANPVSAATQTAQPGSVTSILDALFGNGTTLGQNWQALVSSGAFTQLPSDVLIGLLALMTADTVVQQVGPDGALRQAMLVPSAPMKPLIVPPLRGLPTGARPVAAQPRIAGRVGGLSVPPGWAQPRETVPPSVVVNPASQRFQAGIPVPPAIPVMTAGRSSQSRHREPPEYGAVSKVLPIRHPSAG
jgi:PPE-repeat protein